MNQPPALQGQLASRPSGERSALVKALGVLMAGPILILAVATLWVPASSILLSSFQNRPNGGPSAGATWTDVLGFTLAVAVERLLASIVPIVFAMSLAFVGAVIRHIARIVFLFFRPSARSTQLRFFLPSFSLSNPK